MANVKFKGNPAHTSGELPQVGTKAPAFKLVRTDLSEASLESYKDYGLLMADTPLAGLCSRAVVVLSADDKVLYTEQVAEIGNEPNYEAALKAVR